MYKNKILCHICVDMIKTLGCYIESNVFVSIKKGKRVCFGYVYCTTGCDKTWTNGQTIDFTL